MSTEFLVYSPLLEEGSDNQVGWDKSTVDFIIKNRSKVYRQIKGIAKKYRRDVQQADVEDMYMDILQYIYHASDYDINKAYENSGDNSVLSLEGYLNVCINLCVLRFCVSLNEIDKYVVHDRVLKDGEFEFSLLDNATDKDSLERIEQVMYDLDELCKSTEPFRYKYGVDIYMVWFIRLLSLGESDSKSYQSVLSLLGVSKKDLSIIKKASSDDEDIMSSFARAISIIGVDRAIPIIRKYVYCADKIEAVMNNV